jgi:hypothetical protein
VDRNANYYIISTVYSLLIHKAKNKLSSLYPFFIFMSISKQEVIAKSRLLFLQESFTTELHSISISVITFLPIPQIHHHGLPMGALCVGLGHVSSWVLLRSAIQMPNNIIYRHHYYYFHLQGMLINTFSFEKSLSYWTFLHWEITIWCHHKKSHAKGRWLWKIKLTISLRNFIKFHSIIDL